MAERQRWRGRWEESRERQMGGQDLVEHEQPQLEEHPWEYTPSHLHTNSHTHTHLQSAHIPAKSVELAKHGFCQFNIQTLQ